MRPLRLALLPAIAALALFATPVVTSASCIQPPPIEQVLKTAEIVFVGTVTATSNRDSWANVTVEEIWKGPDQAASIVIKGGPGGNAATSVDRSFKPGAKYLFFPYVSGGELLDNSCTLTTEWSADLQKLRPADARVLDGAKGGTVGSDLGGLLAPLAPFAVAILIAGVLLAVGLLARRRQSARRRVQRSFD